MVTSFSLPAFGSDPFATNVDLTSGFPAWPPWATARAGSGVTLFGDENPDALASILGAGYYIVRGCLNVDGSTIPAAALLSNPRVNIVVININPHTPVYNSDNADIIITPGQFSDVVAVSDWGGMIAGNPTILGRVHLADVPLAPGSIDIPLSPAFLASLNRSGGNKLAIFISSDYPDNIAPTGADGFVSKDTTVFVDFPTLPYADTLDATNISSLGADLNGELYIIGDTPFVDVAFQWGTASGVYTKTTNFLHLLAISPYSIPLAGLTQNTTYYYRTVYYDNNRVAPIYGVEKSLTTLHKFLYKSQPLSRTGE